VLAVIWCITFLIAPAYFTVSVNICGLQPKVTSFHILWPDRKWKVRFMVLRMETWLLFSGCNVV
jgi:hypothetical protein